MYHHVKPHVEPSFKNLKYLSLDTFRSHLLHIVKSNKKVYSLKDLDRYIAEFNKVPPDGYMLTFDDGLADHYNWVAPLLKEFNLPGIFFIQSGMLKGNFLKVHLLQILLANFDSDLHFVNFIQKKLDLNNLPKFVNRWDSTKIAQLKYFLQTYNPHERSLEILYECIKEREISLEHLHSKFYLNSEQIREISNYFEVGLHSHMHERYEFLNEKQFNQDFLQNLNLISKIAENKKIYSIAYPYGSVPKELSIEFLIENEIRYGFTTIARNFQSLKLFHIPRFDCNDFDRIHL
jgi:peptidoglycan/xylan/chitin deacetylase (PgdA/CDA1 family)